MLRSLREKFREWLEEKHYGSLTGLALEWGLWIMAAIVLWLLASMIASAM